MFTAFNVTMNYFPEQISIFFNGASYDKFTFLTSAHLENEK